MSRVRVCFLGTSEFAATCLEALYSDEHFEIVGVVTQPDRPSGRGLKLTPSPVKSWALAKGLKVISPESVSQNLMIQEIQRWGAESAAVVSFGQLLSEDFLRIFPMGAVNVHASLLPKWRGAAPIQRAIAAGDSITGVCLQKVVKALDAGDVLGSRTTNIDPNETALELHDRLAILGADLLKVEYMDYLRGNLAGHPQEHSQKTYAKKILKEECEINWNRPALDIHNQIRAFTMGPGSWCLFGNKKLKIHTTRFLESPSGGEVGRISLLEKDRMAISAIGGSVELIEVQIESKSRMKIEDFIKAHQNLQSNIQQLKLGQSLA